MPRYIIIKRIHICIKSIDKYNNLFIFEVSICFNKSSYLIVSKGYPQHILIESSSMILNFFH